MRKLGWRRRHPVLIKLIWAGLALVVGEAALVFYYLDNWLTLPLL